MIHSGRSNVSMEHSVQFTSEMAMSHHEGLLLLCLLPISCTEQRESGASGNPSTHSTLN
jgi:hypothetical protein